MKARIAVALAEVIQNLLLFIPLGMALVLAGVRPLRAIAPWLTGLKAP